MANKPTGRPPKYRSAIDMQRDIDKYFRSITRTRPATEKVITGYMDEARKKPIYAEKPLLDDNGEQIYTVEYIEHPSILKMCIKLDMTRETLSRYEEKQPFCDVVKKAKSRVESYLETQLMRKEQVTGVIFALKNNFKWQDKNEIELSGSKDKPLTIDIVVLDQASAPDTAQNGKS